MWLGHSSIYCFLLALCVLAGPVPDGRISCQHVIRHPVFYLVSFESQLLFVIRGVLFSRVVVL